MDNTDNKRQAIINATLNLICRDGFQGTAMSKLAKEAKVSAGIIYHYFENKDDLMEELYKEIKTNLTMNVLKSFNEKQSLRIQIRNICEAFIRYYLENPKHAMFMAQYTAAPCNSEAVYKSKNSEGIKILECIKQAREAKIIKDLPHEVLASFVVDIPASLAQKEAAGLITITEDLIEQVVKAIWQATKF